MKFTLLAKPQNFEFLSLLEKAKFIKACCEFQLKIYAMAPLRLFVRQEGIHIAYVKAMHRYMEGYIQWKENDSLSILAACWEKGRNSTRASFEAHSRIVRTMPTDEIAKLYPLRKEDIELAYLALSQHGLSTTEFYFFGVSIDNQVRYLNYTPDNTLRTAPYLLVMHGVLYEEQKKWASRFPAMQVFDDGSRGGNTQKCAIKSGSVMTTGLAGALLLMNPAELLVYAVMMIVVSAFMYGISGELGDKLVARKIPEPAQKPEAENPHFRMST